MKCREFLADTIAADFVTINQSGVRAWDRAGQLRRREEVDGLHGASMSPLFDTDGNWTAKGTPPARCECL